MPTVLEAVEVTKLAIRARSTIPKGNASKVFSFTPDFSPVGKKPGDSATVSTVFSLLVIETAETVLNWRPC
jgi:hypothetical protein